MPAARLGKLHGHLKTLRRGAEPEPFARRGWHQRTWKALATRVRFSPCELRYTKHKGLEGDKILLHEEHEVRVLAIWALHTLQRTPGLLDAHKLSISPSISGQLSCHSAWRHCGLRIDKVLLQVSPIRSTEGERSCEHIEAPLGFTGLLLCTSTKSQLCGQCLQPRFFLARQKRVRSSSHFNLFVSPEAHLRRCVLEGTDARVCSVPRRPKPPVQAGCQVQGCWFATWRFTKTEGTLFEGSLLGSLL